MVYLNKKKARLQKQISNDRRSLMLSEKVETW